MLGPTAVKQDLAISCFKPSKQIIQTLHAQDSLTTIWEFVDDLLKHIKPYNKQGNQMDFIGERDPKILYDRLVSFYVQMVYKFHLMPKSSKQDCVNDM